MEKVVLKLHGVFMIIAWVVIVPNASFIARYFKESYRNVQFFGYPVWLLVSFYAQINLVVSLGKNVCNYQMTQVHVVSIVFAALFIVIGIVFAMYQTFGVIGDIPCEYDERIHFIVGWIACFLFFVQVVLGTLRPTKSGVGKTIVDAMHFFVGTISYLLARKCRTIMRAMR